MKENKNIPWEVNPLQVLFRMKISQCSTLPLYQKQASEFVLNLSHPSLF